MVQRLSFDPWGKQRNANGTSAACGTITASTTRGFTGQEEMPAQCLVNLNARLYDTSIGKFMAPDPLVGAPYAPNAFNRYAYVLNNPLSFTDPSGLCFLGICTWFRSPIVRDLVAIAAVIVLQQYEVLPELEAAVGITTPAAGVTAAAAASEAGLSGVNAALIGGISGGISSGSLKGVGLGILQAGLFYGSGDLLSAEGASSVLGSHTVDTIVAHGVVGGISSVAGGGSFGSGFLAAGFGDLADNPAFDTGNFVANVVEHAVLGGVGSELGGGKFANGAVTGAFGYLFNCSLHPGTCTAADAKAIRQGMQSCPSVSGNACANRYITDAQEAGIVGNPTRDLLVFEGASIGLAVLPYGGAAGEWVIEHGALIYRGFDVLINPIKDTSEILIELKPPPAAELKDIPEVVNETEKWLEGLKNGFKLPPKK